MPGRSVRSVPGERVHGAASLAPKTAPSGPAGTRALTSHSPAQWRKQSSAGLNPGATLATWPAALKRELRLGCQAAPATPPCALAGGRQNQTAPPRYGKQPLRWQRRGLCDPGIICGWPEQVAPGPLGDKSEGKVQRGAPRNPACYLLPAGTCCRTAAIPAPSSTASIMASQPMQELIIMWYSRRSVQSRS